MPTTTPMLFLFSQIHPKSSGRYLPGATCHHFVKAVAAGGVTRDRKPWTSWEMYVDCASSTTAAATAGLGSISASAERKSGALIFLIRRLRRQTWPRNVTDLRLNS